VGNDIEHIGTGETFLKKKNTDISLLCKYPKDAPSYHNVTCSNMFTVALFIIEIGNKYVPQQKNG
jgi:hypothetical protein